MKQFMLILIFFATSNVIANEDISQVKDKHAIVKALKETLIKHYIWLDNAEQAATHLTKFSQTEDMTKLSNKKELAKALQEEAQKSLNDKHFRVIVRRNRESVQHLDILEQHLNALNDFRKGGFQDIKMLEGNVGYVKINGFRAEDSHQVDGLMTYLRTADAIIFDLRENGGGSKPVNYLSSYFLPEQTLIGKTYHRQKDSWTELRAEKVKGDRRLDVPLFILTSNFTFSAAEAFSYNLQAQNRATIVGEVTGGGAHPVSFFDLPEGLAVIVPNRRSYNPITQTNWEGTGVIPDVLVTKKLALDKAHELARLAAKTYREELFTELSNIFNTSPNNTEVLEDRSKRVKAIVEQLIERRHIEPFMVTGFAQRFQEQGNIQAATLLRKVNE